MKNRIFLFIVVFTAISLMLTVNGFSEPFTEDHWSARSAGMGNAFTAMADDIDALFFNPSGTALLSHNQGIFNNLRPQITGENVPSYNVQALSLGFPANKNFCWGLGWTHFREKLTFQENTYILNFSGRINSIFPEILNNDLYFGVNLKDLIYTPNVNGQDYFDSITDGISSKSAFGADAGILYRMTSNLNIGASMLNLNRPKINISDAFNRVPAELRIGAAYHVPANPVFDGLQISRLRPTLDLIKKNTKWMTNFGMEVAFFKDLFELHGGVNSDEAATGITFGAIKARNYLFNLGYSFIYSYGSDTSARKHMVSISITRKPMSVPVDQETKETRISPYRFGPEDVIQIITRNHDEFSGTFTIDPYGKIMVQLIGEISLEGLTKQEMTEKLKQEIGKYVQDPTVLVTTIKYRSNIIYVLGEVKSPGKYPIQGDFISLRDAIAAAGLPTGLAATWRVYVIKPSNFKPTYRVVNFYKILYQGKLANNILLTPDDVVYVPATILGKLSYSLSYLLDPFFKARNVATPLSSPKPLIETEENTTSQ